MTDQWTVLVAHNERPTVELITAVLHRDGYRVIATHDGGDAVARIHEAPPDVVIAQHGLSLVASKQLCMEAKYLREETRFLLLAGDEVSDAERSEMKSQAQYDDVVPEPFSYQHIRPILRGWQGLEDQTAKTEAKKSFALPAAMDVPDLEALAPQAPERPAGAQALLSSTAPSELLPIPIPAEEAAPVSEAPVVASDPPKSAATPEAQEISFDDIAITSNEQATGASPPAENTDPSEPATVAGEELNLDALEALPPNGAPEARAGAPAPSTPESDPLDTGGMEIDFEEVALEPPAEEKKAAPVLQIPTGGTLADYPVSRLVFELYLATFTGKVTLARNGVNRIIHFKGGFPFRVDAKQLSENLGQLLLRDGKVTEQQYAQAQALVQGNGINQGEAFIRINALNERELLDALELQTEVKLANSFAWRDGNFLIESGPAEDGVRNQIHPLRALWRGVQENYDLNSLIAFFSESQESYLVASDSFSIHAPTLLEYFKEIPIEVILNGKTSVGHALKLDPVNTVSIAQAIYVMLVTEMVRLEQAPGAAADIPKAGASKPMAYTEFTEICENIAREYVRVSDGDYYEALGVQKTDQGNLIEQAHQAKVKPFLPSSLPNGLPDDALRRAREIVEALNKARATLSDPQKRQRYEASLKKGEMGLELDLAAVSRAGNIAIGAEQLYAQGQQRFERGAAQEALDLFEQAAKAEPNEPTYHVAIGLAVANLDASDENRRKSVSCFMKALQIDPAHVEANLQMAKALIGSGHGVTAVPYLERILYRAPDQEEAKMLLSNLK